MPEMLDALRTAAAALLTAAPEPIVRRMLRELLAEDAPATPNALGTVQASNARARGVPSAELPGQASQHPANRPIRQETAPIAPETATMRPAMAAIGTV